MDTTRKYQLGNMSAREAAPHVLVLRHLAKTADELYGILRGIMADGEVSIRDTIFLREYLRKHPCTAQWPFIEIAADLEGIFNQREPTASDCAELTAKLRAVLGQTAEEAVQAPTMLPVEKPQPDVVFAKKRFCVTGQFVYGTRNRVGEAIVARGGRIDGQVFEWTDYVVIGSVASTGWKHGSFGSKIEKAVMLRSAGHSIKIISEDHWNHWIEQTPSDEPTGGIIVRMEFAPPN